MSNQNQLQAHKTLDTFVVYSDRIINSGISKINGNVGIVSEFGEIEGLSQDMVNGQIIRGGQIAIVALTELRNLVNDILSRNVDQTFANLNNLTLLPGVYDVTSQLILSNGQSVTLDAQNNPNAIFIIKFITSSEFKSNSRVILAGGAEPQNIYWYSQGFTVYENATVYGKLIGQFGNIMRKNATLVGNLWSTSFIAIDSVIITKAITPPIPIFVLDPISVQEVNNLLFLSSDQAQSNLVTISTYTETISKNLNNNYNKKNKKYHIVYKTLYKVIVITIKYIYYVLLAFKPAFDISPDLLNDIKKIILDDINENIIGYKNVEEFKLARKLKKFKKQIIIKLNNLETIKLDRAIKKIHEYYIKLKNLYTNLLNELFKVTADKFSVETFMIEKNNELDSFQINIINLINSGENN